MNSNKVAKTIIRNISSFCVGFFGKPIPPEAIPALEASTAREVEYHRPTFSVDDKCNIIDGSGRRVYHAPTQKQAQEIADAFSTYV